MFEGALWESKSYAKKTIIGYLMFIPLIMLLSVPFIIHFLGFGAVAIIMLALALVVLFVLAFIGRKFKWHNSKLVFAFTEEGVCFTSTDKNVNSYFHEVYANISGYSYVAEEGSLTTVNIYFKLPVNAGIMGNIKSLQMIRIENFDKLKEVLTSYGLEEIKIAEKKK